MIVFGVVIDLPSLFLGIGLGLPAYLFLDRVAFPLLERPVGRHGGR